MFGSDTVLRNGEETGIAGQFKDVIITTITKTFVILVWYGVWTVEDLMFDHFEVELAVSAWISYVSIS